MGKNFTYVPGAEFPYQYKYEHMAVTTDCVIFTWEEDALKVLLVRRGGEPYKGAWAFPGGFLQMNETAMEGALRELREETALEPSAIKELGVFSDVDRAPERESSPLPTMPLSSLTRWWAAMMRTRRPGFQPTTSLPWLSTTTGYSRRPLKDSAGISISSQ